MNLLTEDKLKKKIKVIDIENMLKGLYQQYGVPLVLYPATAKSWGIKEDKDKPWICISKPLPLVE
jgi:hypothetical protein